MARRRFFVNAIHSGHAELTGEDAAHLARVLRVEAGRHYEISDNRRSYLAVIESARKDRVVFRVMEVLDPEPVGLELTLLAALIKFDRFELLIEKATELGVTEIVPVRTVRSEHGLEKAALKRIERWRKIAVEASEQSRRTHLPEIRDPLDFNGALSSEACVRILLDEDREASPIARVLPETRSREDSVAILAGPEGGWTEEEREAAVTAGWKPASLGRRVLRTETACIAALAVVQSAYA
jgi:16S rRNA (uracil1498-N3)-methyltransferase